MADIFVDQSAANNGNGTSAAQASTPGGVGAYNTFASVSPSSGDHVWIRRTATLVLLTTGRTLSITNVAYIGWPMAGDLFYASRPASGTSAGWDSDAPTYAELQCATILTVDTFIISGAGVDLERLKLTANYVSATSSKAVLNMQASCTLNNVYLLYTGATISSTQSFALQSSSGTPVCKMTNVTMELSAALAGTGAHMLFYCGVAGDFEFINCSGTYSGSPTDTAVQFVNMQNGIAPVLSFIDCTFTKTGTAGTGTLFAFASSNASLSVAMNNVTVVNGSTATSGDDLQTTSAGGVFIAQRLNIANGRRINLQSAGHYCHCATFTQGRSSSDYAVQMVAGATFAANNFTECGGNTSGAINGTVASDILLQNTSFQSANPYGSASPIANIFEADSGGTYGAWKFTGRRGTVTASAVYRTGGESFSLKFYMTTGSQNYLGFLQAMLNGLETIFASLTPANTTITIYGAAKGYSPAPDASQIWADCDYLDGASGAHRTFASSRGAPGTALGSDSSTWNGDTGLTAFKLVIPVSALQNCLAPIRLFDNLRQSNAFFYIDPKPVVT